MDLTLKNLVEAEKKAQQLFNEIENKNILIAGNSENRINELIFELAFNMFGIKNKPTLAQNIETPDVVVNFN